MAASDMGLSEWPVPPTPQTRPHASSRVLSGWSLWVGSSVEFGLEPVDEGGDVGGAETVVDVDDGDVGCAAREHSE